MRRLESRVPENGPLGVPLRELRLHHDLLSRVVERRAVFPAVASTIWRIWVGCASSTQGWRGRIPSTNVQPSNHQSASTTTSTLPTSISRRALCPAAFPARRVPGTINGPDPAAHHTSRVGVETGVFTLGSPCEIEFSLKITS